MESGGWREVNVPEVERVEEEEEEEEGVRDGEGDEAQIPALETRLCPQTFY